MEKKIYIFGAHSRAQTLGIYLQRLHPDTVIEAYLYDNDEENPKHIGTVNVIRLDPDVHLHTDYQIYIATRGIYHSRIIKILKRYGFNRIYPVTVGLDLKLRNQYLEKYYQDMGRTYVKIGDLSRNGTGAAGKTARIYVAVSAFDKPLQQSYVPACYETRIQAGAALTEKHIPGCQISDHAGEHISDRNRQFCELTVLYWLWKHAGEDIVGLAHYRRHFILPQDWLERMQENNVDVILPVPLYVAPSLAENYKSRHDPSDWDYMMQYLKAGSEQEYLEAEAFFQKNLYSPCNMFIMRREVLDALCAWLFPILFAAAEHGGQKADGYLNRYPGFLSERLITFFFEKNRSKYRAVYSDKNFLS